MRRVETEGKEMKRQENKQGERRKVKKTHNEMKGKEMQRRRNTTFKKGIRKEN